MSAFAELFLKILCRTSTSLLDVSWLAGRFQDWTRLQAIVPALLLLLSVAIFVLLSVVFSSFEIGVLLVDCVRVVERLGVLVVCEHTVAQPLLLFLELLNVAVRLSVVSPFIIDELMHVSGRFG